MTRPKDIANRAAQALPSVTARPWHAWLVALIGVLLTTGAFLRAVDLQYDKARVRFEHDVALASRLIVARLRAHHDLLLGVRAQAASGGLRDSADLQAHAKALRLAERFPELDKLFLAGGEAEGALRLHSHLGMAPARATLDSPALRGSIHRARSSGNLVAFASTPPSVLLLRDLGEALTDDFLGVELRLDRVIAGLLGREDLERVRVRIVAMDEASSETLYDSGPDSGESAMIMSAAHDLRVGEQRWRLIFAARSDLMPVQDLSVPGYTLAAGLVITALLAALVRSLARSRRTAIALANRMTADLRASEARFRLAVRGLSVGLWDWDVRTNAVYYSPRFKQLLGYDEEEFERVFHSMDWQRLHPDDQARALSALQSHLANRTPFEIEYRLRMRSGEYRWFEARGQAEWDAAGLPTRMAGSIADITERKRAETDLLHVATHDILTGLPNRSLFHSRLTHALERAQRTGKPLAVLFIDLDRFKIINDTLGHKAGDQVLIETARRLTECLRESDTVARLGGDEFVVLIEEFGAVADLENVARKLLETITQPIALEGNDYHLTGSIGVAAFPEDGRDAAALLKNADIAMYRAKEQGKNNHQFYSAQFNIHSQERLALESALRRAVERQEFVLHYQPKIELASGRITGMEALVRWIRPGVGMVPPAQFIPLAEETGLILPIGEWVIARACAATRRLIDAGHGPLKVAVNLSPRHFGRGALVDEVRRVLADSGLPASALELEITESMVMSNPERAVDMLNELKALGVSLAMDDFGTGHASLGSLKRFPFDRVKVDRSFILDLPGDLDDCAITQAVIGMAHSLRKAVCAEGVETEAQLAFLRAQACDEAQGYYFSRPLAEDDFAAWLKAHRTTTVADAA